MSDTYGDFDFANREVVVTGGLGGIGNAIVRAFASAGAHVTVMDKSRGSTVSRSSTGTSKLAEKIEFVKVDVTSETQVKQAFSEDNGIGSRRVDVLVLAVGESSDKPLAEISVQEWEREIRVNLTSAFLCAREVLPIMKKQGGGAIVFIGSINGLIYCGNEAYSAAKAALPSLARSIAVRHGGDGIRANVVALGTVRTRAWQRRQKERPNVLDEVAKWYPANRIAEPADVVGPVIFLASSYASWVNGVTLVVDGGLTAGNKRFAIDILGW